MELDLSGVINDLGTQLYREGEDAGAITKRGGLFTWRKQPEDKGTTPRKAKSNATIGAQSTSSDTLPSTSMSGPVGSTSGKSGAHQEFAMVERLHHKKAVTSILWLPNSNPSEVWTLDMSGVVNRWSTISNSASRLLLRKGTRDVLASFQTATQEGYAMALCNGHVWISAGNEVEVYDLTGVLVWTVPVKARSFLEFGNCVWLGGEGGVALYEESKQVLRVDFEASDKVFVSCMVRVNEEIWASHGRSVSIISEATAKVVDEVPSFAENRINDMAVGKGYVWMACDNGKIIRWNSQTRTIVNTIEAHEGRAFAVALSSTRLWTCGWDKTVRTFDLESCIPESIMSGHEDSVDTIRLVDAGGKMQLWSGSADKTVGIWEPVARKSSLFHARDESDEFEDSISEMSGSLTDTKSPRGISPAFLMDNLRKASTPIPSSSGSLSERSTRSPRGSGNRSPRRRQHPVGTSATDDDMFKKSPRLKRVGEEERISGSNSPGGKSPRESSITLVDDSEKSESSRKPKKRILSKVHLAVQSNNVEKLRNIMESIENKYESEKEKLEARKKQLDRRGPNKRTPLHMAALQGHLDCVKQLVEWGADICAKDKYDLYPIHLTAQTDIKLYLLQQFEAAGLDPGLGKNVPSKARHGRTKSMAVPASSSSSSRDYTLDSSGAGNQLRGRRPVKKRSHIRRGRTDSVQDMLALSSSPNEKKEEVKVKESDDEDEDDDDVLQVKQKESETSKTEQEEANEKSSAEEIRAAVLIQSNVRMMAAKKEKVRLLATKFKRDNIVDEMLKTEEHYVSILEVLCNKIRTTMSTQSFRNSVQGGMSDQDIKTIFPTSLTMLLNAHQSWLSELKERQNNWSPQSCVGDLFLKLSPYLKMYIVYVSNFELSTLKMRELKKRDKSNFGELVHEVFVNLGDPTNDLASMLVTPVQRIPRYVMMLKDLLKHTSTQHPDYNNLLKAVKIMTDTTVLVDRKADDAKVRKKRRGGKRFPLFTSKSTNTVQSSQKVLEVADLIVEAPVAIVQPNRKWVKDGPVGLVVGLSDIRPRHAFLFSDVLVLCALCENKKKGRKEGKDTKSHDIQYRYQKEVSMLAASVRSIKEHEVTLFEVFFAVCLTFWFFFFFFFLKDTPNTFLVRTPKLAFIFQVSSETEKASWLKSLVSVIEMRKEGNLSRVNAQTIRAGHSSSDPLSLRYSIVCFCLFFSPLIFVVRTSLKLDGKRLEGELMADDSSEKEKSTKFSGEDKSKESSEF